MSFRRRLFLGAVLVAVVGLMLACGGAKPPKAAQTAAEPTDEEIALLIEEQEAAHRFATDKAELRAKARVKAEQEAEANNQANRKAYEGKVERVKADYEKKIEEY